MGDAADSHLACGVCFAAFDGDQRRPWDIGCGHSFCEQCLRQHPRSFRHCPECRVRASNPHVNIALLRLVDAAAGGQQQQQQQASSDVQQQQQQQQQQRGRSSTLGDAAAPAAAAAAAASQQPQEWLQQVLSRQQGSTPAPNPTGPMMQTVLRAPAPGGLAAHQAKIAEIRTAMWVWLTPLLGFLYLLSPLDIIPDFLPLIGWLDDLLVLVYVACSMYGMFGGRRQQQDRNRMTL
ncbi:hypothetical protein OEZ86_008993 [Tetradesmus obliquus]|nr:hypothetical protein OEZ86_008993 [Tetradesmus obliquus]